MKTVSHIFGGEGKVKMMRLFIFNPGEAYDVETIIERVRESSSQVRKDLAALEKSGLIKKKVYVKILKAKRGRRPKEVSKRVSGFTLNPNYPFLSPLERFLIDAAPITKKEIADKILKTGNVKLLLISGVFLHNDESRVDLMVVGDNLKQHQLSTNISTLEAELGKELRYAAFETADFRYRLGIYDKLVRDILDESHVKLVNKLGI